MISHTALDAVQLNPRKRRRSAPSCRECRRRKVKCNRLEPCSHCILSNKPCHYGRGTSPVGQTPQGRGSAGHFVHGSRCVPEVSASGVVLPQSFASATEPNSTMEADGLNGSAQGTQLNIQSSGGSFTSSGQGATNETNPGISGVPSQEGAIALNKSRLFGRSHWSNATIEVC